jgi:hypothetical protein
MGSVLVHQEGEASVDVDAPVDVDAVGVGGLQCPPGTDPEAFACLPEEIQREVIREYESTNASAAELTQVGQGRLLVDGGGRGPEKPDSPWSCGPAGVWLGSGGPGRAAR